MILGLVDRTDLSVCCNNFFGGKFLMFFNDDSLSQL